MSGKRGFTLIELLVVISILVLLMGILLPAIIKAREVFTVLKARGQVRSLADACRAYASRFSSQAPAVIAGPPINTGGSPSRVSGAQALALALLGCEVRGSTIHARDEVAVDFENYNNSDRLAPFYTVNRKDNEMVPHNKVWTHTNRNSGYGNFEVFVDFPFNNPRPILYYRRKARITVYEPDTYFQYDFRENEVYCNDGETLAQSGSYNYPREFVVETDELAAFLTSGTRTGSRDGPNKTAYSTGFVIISPGPDRLYFTDDDIVSY